MRSGPAVTVEINTRVDTYRLVGLDLEVAGEVAAAIGTLEDEVARVIEAAFRKHRVHTLRKDPHLETDGTRTHNRVTVVAAIHNKGGSLVRLSEEDVRREQYGQMLRYVIDLDDTARHDLQKALDKVRGGEQ